MKKGIRTGALWFWAAPYAFAQQLRHRVRAIEYYDAKKDDPAFKAHAALRSRKWYAANKERAGANSRSWMKRNPDAVRAIRRRSDRRHKEQRKITRHNYLQRKGPQVRATRRHWYARNKERLRKKHRIAAHKRRAGMSPEELALYHIRHTVNSNKHYHIKKADPAYRARRAEEAWRTRRRNIEKIKRRAKEYYHDQRAALDVWASLFGPTKRDHATAKQCLKALRQMEVLS